MPVTLKIDGRGLAALGRRGTKLRALSNDLENRSEPLEEIKEKQIERWLANYEGEGSEYTAWEGLSTEWTIPERLDLGFGEGPILIRTGGTLNSFVDQNEAGQVSGEDILWTFRNTGGGVRGGAYPLSHHLGYTTSLGTEVPARTLWELDDDDTERAEEIMDEWVDDVIDRYFS